MTVKQAYDLTGDPDYMKIVETAAVRVALAVASEAATVDRHTERAALAAAVVRSPLQWASIFRLSLVADDTLLGLLLGQVNTSYQLPQIESRISAVWNAYLG